jgi:hypothetical protein
MVKRPVGRPRKTYRADVPGIRGDAKPEVSDVGIPISPAAIAEPEPVPDAVEPGTATGSAPSGADESERKRGRPRKKEAAEDLTELLLSAHFMLAQLTKIPELEIAPEEAAKMARAIDRVQKLYDKSILSEEASAWMNLMMACGTVYGPRYFVLRKHRNAKPKVVDIPSPRTVEDRAAAEAGN